MAGQKADPATLSIACLIHSLVGGGAERVMAGLASRLAARGHQVTLITYDDALVSGYVLDDRVNRVGLNLKSGARGLIAKASQVRRRHQVIRESLLRLSPDVVLSFCDRNNIDALAASESNCPPIVVSERSDPRKQSIGLIWNAVRKRVYPRAAAVVALTDASAKPLRKYCENVVVIPSAIEPPKQKSDRALASEQKVIVGAGRLEPEKGFDRLLEAFARATRTDPHWRLVIYGEGTLRPSLERRARKLRISDRFSLPGWVQPLWEPLSQATLFCLSSHYEGFPSVLLEAMSMGVPTVSADCESGPRVIIDHGCNGLLVEPSIDGLASGITRMIENSKYREKLGLAGQQVTSQFSWEKMVDSYERVLRQAAENGSGWQR